MMFPIPAEEVIWVFILCLLTLGLLSSLILFDGTKMGDKILGIAVFIAFFVGMIVHSFNHPWSSKALHGPLTPYSSISEK